MKSSCMLVLAALSGAAATASQAAPGDLDTSFAGFGYGGFSKTSGATAAMAMGPDGKIVTVGHSGVQLIVYRYLPDGSLDRTFSGDGVAFFLNPSFAMRATAVALQPDGKIVVAGWAEVTTDDFLLARVTTSGTIDYSFGGGGYVTTDFAGQGDHAEGVVVQPDGRIVAAGTSTVGGDTDFSVARYNANGSPDTSFSGDGRTTIGFGGDEECNELALQADGRLVLVGDTASTLEEQDFAVARLNGDGTLDDSFHFDGKATVGLDGWDTATCVAIQPDGGIVVAGYRDLADGVLARFLSNGFLDPSLDGDGRLTVGGDELWGVAVQPDGRIVLVGEESVTSPAPDNLLAVHRLLSNGAGDPTFDGDGHASFDLATHDKGRGLALLPDGRIVAHGTTGSDHFTQNSSLLLRLWQDGSVDVGGTTALGFPESLMGPGADERATAMVMQPDGKLIVVGEVANAANSEVDFGIARFLPEGDPDPSFGTAGCATFSFHNFDVARAVALQPDGKIVVAGHTGSGNGINFLVARFNGDGTLDTSFGFFGYNVLDFLGGADYAQAVAIAPDGKIVLAGTVYNGARYVFGICRFTSDGVADYSFDLDAKQLHEIFFDVPHWATSVVVQDDLKIVVGGHVNYDFALARYHESGAVDYSFGQFGQGFTIHDMLGDDYLGALLRAPNGWFYAAGSHTWVGNTDFALAQFQPDGAPGNVWIGGRAYIDFTGYDVTYSLDLRDDGHIIAAGCGNGIVTWAQWNTATTDYPHAGWTDIVGVGECATGVRFFGPRHLVTAATQDFNGDQNFILAKFETVPSSAPTAVDDAAPHEPRLALRLHAAYPNPLNGRSVIAFDLARSQPVRVAVYDAAGRRVRTLAAGSFDAGRHESVWDGRDDGGRGVAAGVYFVRADAGTARAQQKIILLK